MQHVNWVIGALEPELRADFAKDLVEVELEHGQVLQTEGGSVEQVYFPTGAVIGLFSTVPTGEVIETAMVGWDGALGVFEACGSRRSTCRAQVQIPGRAWRMRGEAYRRAFERSNALREHVHKYVELLLMEARQYVACNALHSVEARLSRSILEALDRADESAQLPMTQEELAQMLGVQRTTVTLAINQLQAAGALRSRRGVIQVIDRKQVERRACCCWRTVADARNEILGSPEPVCADEVH